jgi:hypothetical protein
MFTMHLCSQCTYALIILCNLKSLVPYRRTIIETSTMPQLQHPPNVWIVEASTAVPPHVHAATSTPTSPVGIYAGSDTSLACPTTDCLDASLLAGSDTSDCPAARTSPTLAVSSNHSSTPVFHVEVGTNSLKIVNSGASSQIDYDSSHASPVHIVGDTMHLAGLLSA